MTDIERALRDSISRHVKELPTLKGSEILPSPTRLARRRAVTFAGITVVMLGIATAGFTFAQAVMEREDVPARPPSTAAGESDSADDLNRSVTPREVVGSGNQGGQTWSLWAYKAVAEGERSRDLGIEGRTSLCWGMDLEQEVAEGPSCYLGLAESFGQGDHLYVVPDIRPRGVTAFYGKVAPSVERVELRTQTRGEQSAQVYVAAPSLEVDFKFFVGFAPEGADVTVAALNEGGQVLETDRVDALPLLTVEREGPGDGTVRAFHSEQLDRGEAPPLLDCGVQCSVELDDVDVVLEATPASGSRFTGWQGACQGEGSCRVSVDEDRTVVATFSDAADG